MQIVFWNRMKPENCNHQCSMDPSETHFVFCSSSFPFCIMSQETTTTDRSNRLMSTLSSLIHNRLALSFHRVRNEVFFQRMRQMRQAPAISAVSHPQ